MRSTLGLIVLLLSGCATVASQRTAGAKAEFTTAKPVAVVQSCISKSFDGEHYPVVFTPSAEGGSFAYRVNGTLFWTLDLADQGSERRLSLYGANDSELHQRIASCL